MLKNPPGMEVPKYPRENPRRRRNMLAEYGNVADPTTLDDGTYPMDAPRMPGQEPFTDDKGLGDTLDAIGSRILGGDFMPREIGDEFLQSQQGAYSRAMWDQAGGPTDSAVEELEALFTDWWNKRNTMPELPR